MARARRGHAIPEGLVEIAEVLRQRRHEDGGRLPLRGGQRARLGQHGRQLWVVRAQRVRRDRERHDLAGRPTAGLRCAALAGRGQLRAADQREDGRTAGQARESVRLEHGIWKSRRWIGPAMYRGSGGFKTPNCPAFIGHPRGWLEPVARAWKWRHSAVVRAISLAARRDAPYPTSDACA